VVKKTLRINYSPHTGQNLVHKSKARFKVLVAGRKWGKTTCGVMEAFHYLGKPNSVVWWVAPYQSVALVGWRRFLELVPRLIIKSIDKKNSTITLINNSTATFKSADNVNALVGEGIDLLILDEAARIRENTWLETLRPNLDDPRHFGRALLISTPMSHNWFYRAFELGLKRKNGWESWSHPYLNLSGGFPSWLNPHFKQESLQDAKRLPEKIFLQQYAARFLQDLGEVFHDVMSARQGDLEPALPEEEYFAGIDWGRSDSFTVVTILNSSGHLVAFDRFRRMAWKRQVARVARLLREYNARALCDNTGIGDPIFDMLYSHYSNIRPFKINVGNKADLIENLVVMIERKDITYPDIPELLEELAVFGAKQHSTGTFKYSAPKGFHDDFVISLALAAWQIRKRSHEAGFAFFPVF